MISLIVGILALWLFFKFVGCTIFFSWNVAKILAYIIGTIVVLVLAVVSGMVFIVLPIAGIVGIITLVTNKKEEKKVVNE